MTRKTAQKPGRPSLYTPKLGRRICKTIEETGFETQAARLHGIHRNTLAAWKAEHEDFAIELEAAKAKKISKVLKHPKLDPHRMLEWMDPETFTRAPVPTQNVTVNQNTTVIPRDQALAELRELAKTDPEIAKLLKAESDDSDAPEDTD